MSNYLDSCAWQSINPTHSQLDRAAPARGLISMFRKQRAISPREGWLVSTYIKYGIIFEVWGQ
jgi:hypothetical protein